MSDPGTQSAGQYVVFRLRSEEYGLPVSAVRTIIRYEPPTFVPRAPRAVTGVINLRGEVVPVVDLGERLFGSPIVPGPSARIIVIESPVGPVGLAVDAATEVAQVDSAAVKPAPEAALDPETSEAFEGVVLIGDRLVILIDPGKVLPGAVSAGTSEEGDDLDG